jgi:hypothetical protein
VPALARSGVHDVIGALATGGLLKLRFRCPLSLALAWIAPEGAAAAATATNLERSRLASLSLALVGPLGVNPKRSIFGGPRLRCSLALACMT